MNEDPPKGFAYKGVLPPSQLAKLTGVSTFDLVKVLEIPLLLNFGAFAHRSYPTIPLEIAREERDCMSIFSILNKTVTFVPTVETRIESIAKTTVYGPVHDKEVAIRESPQAL